MAESVGDLFIRMGVDTSELDSGFVSAERTVTENLARLNREQHMIQIRGQIELDGLEEAASASEKVRVQAEALTKQMEIQRDKIAMVSTAYEDLRSRYGETSEITQQAALALEQERLAMSNLQKQTQELSKQQEIALGVNVEMLGLIPSAIKGVEMLIAAGHAIPIPHAKAAAGVATALLAVAAGSAEATMELREENPAKVLDEEFAKAESGISGSWEQIENDTKNASGEIKDATAEINESISEMGESAEETADEIEDVLDLMQTEDVGDAIKKANDLFEESDSILGRLGKTILGIAGTMSAFESSMIKAAQPAIEGFRELATTAKELNLSLDATNDLLARVKLAGADFDDVRDYVRGVQDAVIKGDSTDPEVIALEKYGVAIQDANGNLLAFDETLDRLYQGYLKAREAGEAEAYAMMTNGQAVKDILPYFESLAKAEEDRAKIQWSVTDAASLEQASRDLRLMETQIDEFKNALSSLAVPAADIAIKETFEMFKKGTQLIEENRETIVFWSFVVMEAIQSVKKNGGEAADWVLEKLSAAADTLKEFNKRFGLTEKASGLFDAAAEKIGSLKTAIFGESTAEAESFIDRAKKDTEEYVEANEKARAETEKTAEAITAGLSYSYNRIAKYKEELAGIKIDLQFGDDKLGAELAKLEQWHQNALRDARYYEEERAVLAELYAAKREQIERKAAEEIAKAREEAQKRIIESLRNAASKLGSIWNTALENRLAEIEREKQAWIDKGVEEVKATQWAEQAKADARKSAAMSVLKSQLEEYRAFQEGGYEGLMNHRRDELFKSGIKPEDLYMTPETLAKFQKAQDTVERNLLPNFATDYDRAEASRLINNQLVETQQMLHKAFDKLEAKDFLSGREVRAMVSLPTMDRSDLYSTEELEQMYDPVNHMAEEFKNLVPQLGEASEGIKDFNGAITQFSAVEQPTPPEIPTAPESPSSEPAAVQLPEIDTSKIAAAFEELALPLEEFGGQIEELTSQLIDTTSALENLASLEKPSSQETTGVESQLVDSATVERFVAQIAETADATENFKTVVAGFEIPPIDTSAINAEFAELVSPMSEVNTRFAGMSANLADVTNGLAELSRSLNQFSAPQQNQAASQQAQSAPLNITVNVQIDEAHAWDSRHIQELADKVADKIEPELVSAIGGDSNRY